MFQQGADLGVMSENGVKPPDGQLHELKAVAGRLSVSVHTVRRLIAEGALVATNVGTRRRASYRIAEAEVRRFTTARQMLASLKDQAAQDVTDEAIDEAMDEASPPREGTPRNSEASVSESA
jgi:excisionase family DNA binding protein